ncbi:Resolvase domain-containing protein [Arthrobacter crystallopoietes BAB-32]|uniref:Resolvase domain-containing protein n=1 Tax=Arthrobacter crystallopoietes BAB-32 TaxID=1246476 RepID=N1V6B5_9MICC|nr:recombinase family protein [Arthrobacter crystallopoietes]EMY35647.1 Resolvase domain-containing protein [Arthrobacter crystallopoietes BAB-32]
MRLGYARVSTIDQNASMQIEALVEAGVDRKRIFVDEMSGAKEARQRPQMRALLDYAREGDEILVWRIDRLGRSLVDVINTVEDIMERGIALRSIIDGVDPSSAQGRLQLHLFATLAEYERELINERVRAGVQAAKARGVKFGKQPPKQETVETKVKVARQLLSEGKTGRQAAEAVGWSRTTLYRYLKQFGAEQPAQDQVVVPSKGRSSYGSKKTLPARTPRGARG